MTTTHQRKSVTYQGYSIHIKGPEYWAGHRAARIEVDQIVSAILVELDGDYVAMHVLIIRPLSLTSLTKYVDGLNTILTHESLKTTLNSLITWN